MMNHVIPTQLIREVFLGMLLVVGLTLYSYAQEETYRFTVDECIQYAWEHNRTLKNVRFDEYIAQKDVEEVVATGLPQISVAGDFANNFKRPVFVIPGPSGELQDVEFGLPWQASLGATASQLIFDGRFFLGLKASKEFSSLSKLNTQRTREEIAYNISKAYYTALITQEQLNLLSTNITRVEKLYKETKALNEEGFVEKIDVERLEINLNNLRTDQKKVERLSALSVDLLKFQMGMAIDTQLELTETISAVLSEANAISPAEFNPENRIEYTILKSQEQLQEYTLKGHRMGYYPTLYAYSNYAFNWQWDSESNFDFQTGILGLQLNIPIFDGGQKAKKIQKARLEIKKIQENQNEFIAASELEYAQALTNLTNAYEGLQSQDRNKALAEKVFQISRTKYKEGVGSSLEVNEAETQLKTAESNYLNAFYEYLISRLDLDKVQGAFAKYRE